MSSAPRGQTDDDRGEESALLRRLTSSGVPLWWFRPAGDLGAGAVSAFRQSLRSAADGTAVVVDLTRVGFVDNAAVGALVGAVGRIREAGGNVTVAAPANAVRTVFAQLGFDRAVLVVEDLSVAISGAVRCAPVGGADGE